MMQKLFVTSFKHISAYLLTLLYRMGGINFHQTTIFAAISELLRISGRAFVAFPEYELATEWGFQTIPDTRNPIWWQKTGNALKSA